MPPPDEPNKKGPEGGLGGTPSEPCDEATQLPNRISRYSTARSRAREMLSHLQSMRDPGFTLARTSPFLPSNAAKKLDECGNWLAFHHYWTVGKVRLGRASFCKEHLLCPLCAIRRGAKSLGAYLQRFEVIQLMQPQLKPYLMTLTVRNGPDLAERFNHLRNSQGLLMKRRLIKRAVSSLRVAAGGVSSYEFTNKGKGWHPHTHTVLLSAQEPSQSDLRAEWEMITGDSFMCDIRPFHSDQPVAEGFMEVFKYAVKFADLTPDNRWNAYCTLRGRRLLSSFGCFRGVDVPESLLDEPLDGLPFVELVYRYMDGIGYSFARSTVVETEPPYEAFEKVW